MMKLSLCALVFCSWSLVASGGERPLERRYLSGRVVGVTDGDTLTIQDEARVQHRVSLYGVDAPERGQPSWERSRDILAHKLAGQNIRVENVETDRFGRTLGHVYLGERHINLEQVREGYGWHDSNPEKFREFRDAERDAREHRRGLWSENKPIEPWEYRRLNRPVEVGRLPARNETLYRYGPF